MPSHPTPPTASPTLVEMAKKAREAAGHLALLSEELRNQALEAIACSLETHQPAILAANRADLETFKDRISQSIFDRLKLDETKLRDAIKGVRQVKELEDPIDKIQIHRELDEGLILKRVTCPLGVIGVVFEARPDAFIQIASLGIKSGNGTILKPGREAIGTCQQLSMAIEKGLADTQVSSDAIQLIETREEIEELLKLHAYVDLIVPRGSNEFVRYIQENTRIPVLGHADGICHLYVDRAANIDQAVAIAVDSKTQYPAACNAIETLLVHQDIAPRFLPKVASALQEYQVELRGDERTLEFLDSISPATEEDWKTEYCALILSLKVVDSLEDAIGHINQYGSKHTDAIVTEDTRAAETFLNRVDSAGVYHNCSTRFADGFRYGFGAEVGISTQKMPPRGPVGLEGLVTYKYQLVGNGQLVATYSGKNPKPFTHRELG